MYALHIRPSHSYLGRHLLLRWVGGRNGVLTFAAHLTPPHLRNPNLGETEIYMQCSTATCTHTHTHAHAHVLAHIRAHIHAHAHTHARTHARRSSALHSSTANAIQYTALLNCGTAPYSAVGSPTEKLPRSSCRSGKVVVAVLNNSSEQQY
jgi:hypothetical protein